jgi:hypothetical protein
MARIIGQRLIDSGMSFLPPMRNTGKSTSLPNFCFPGIVMQIRFFPMILIVAVVGIARGEPSEIHEAGFPRGSHCECGRCTSHWYGSSIQKPEQPAMLQESPPAMPQESPPAAPTGQYVAPPLSGPAFGGSQGFGIEGPALHFPSLSLKLPTLQLPSLVRIRHHPRMLLDAAQAPYVEQTPTSIPLAAVPAVMMPSPQQQPQVQQQPPQPSPSPQEDLLPPTPQFDRDGPIQRGVPQRDFSPKFGSTTWELNERLQQREQDMLRIEQQIARLQQALETHTVLQRQETSTVYHPPRRLAPVDASHASYEVPEQASSFTNQTRRLPDVNLDGGRR